MKRALITGITGQGGSHLAKFLVGKGYKVCGGCRRMGRSDLWRLEELGLLQDSNISLHEYDASDPISSLDLVEATSPDEIYNLAAQAHVGRSFHSPYATSLVTGLGALNILEGMRRYAPASRFLQASSAELYGNTLITPQNEETPFKPR